MASRALAIEKSVETERAGRIAEAQSEPAVTPEANAGPAVDLAAAEPDHEEIARLAHSYWLSRRPDEGTAEDDWYRAERELRATRGV